MILRLSFSATSMEPSRQLDVTDQILTQLAHPSWREIEREWMLGLIGSRECLERQIALVDAPPEELHAVIDSVTIDPHFSAFCRFTRRRRMPLYIVSDGFDYVIHRVLKRAGVDRGVPERFSACSPARCGWRATGCFPLSLIRPSPASTAAQPAKPPSSAT